MPPSTDITPTPAAAAVRALPTQARSLPSTYVPGSCPCCGAHPGERCARSCRDRLGELDG